MTSCRTSIIDAYLVRPGADGLEFLLLRRGPAGRCAGSWEAVHGHIDPGEQPVQAALREVLEETGLVPERLYNLSRVEFFYQHLSDEIAMIPVFAGIAAAGARVVLGPEHDGHAWLRADEARQRCAWPRERRAIDDILFLLGRGDAGAVEDVLRIDPPASSS